MGSGKSIASLSNEIASRISEIKLIEKLQLQIALTLGRAINDSIDIEFDFELAKDSIQFYQTDDILKINLNEVPKGVTDVRFKSDLTNITAIDLRDIAGGGLFTLI